MASNGVAGEFFVAAELTRRGMIASITGKNTKDIDIMAANPNTGKTVLIQVKEKSLANTSPEWKMNAQYKTNQIDMGVWYVFVDLQDYSCYIISAQELFPKLQKRKEDYDKGLKKNGQPRKPDNCFYFNRDKDMLDDQGECRKNNWDDLPIFE